MSEVLGDNHTLESSNILSNVKSVSKKTLVIVTFNINLTNY